MRCNTASAMSMFITLIMWWSYFLLVLILTLSMASKAFTGSFTHLKYFWKLLNAWQSSESTGEYDKCHRDLIHLQVYQLPTLSAGGGGLETLYWDSNDCPPVSVDNSVNEHWKHSFVLTIRYDGQNCYFYSHVAVTGKDKPPLHNPSYPLNSAENQY